MAKPTMSLGSPVSDKQARRLERVYEAVRGVADHVDAPLDTSKGDQHFVTEVAKYIVGVDRKVVDLPFNPEAKNSLRAKLTKRQRRLIGDVIYVWMTHFATDIGYVEYAGRILLLARFARPSHPLRLALANFRVGHAHHQMVPR